MPRGFRTTALAGAAKANKLAASVTEAELARAKAQGKAQLFMGREAPLNRAEQAAGQILLFGRPYAPAELAAAIDAVDAAAVARVGERLLSPGRAAVAVLGPKRAAAAVEAFQA